MRAAAACVAVVVGIGASALACQAEPPPEPDPWLAAPVVAALQRPVTAAPDPDARWDALTVLRWPATPKRASGIEAATPCFVEAQTDGPRVRRVVAICGAETIYDSDRARYGGPVEGTMVREKAEADALVYALAAAHEADGVRLRVDTRDEIVKLDADSLFGWSIELAVEPWTTARNGAPLLMPEVADRTALLHLRVLDDGGPLARDSACQVDARITGATSRELECAFRVTCDDREVIGPATPGTCAMTEKSLSAMSIADDDGRPRLTWKSGEDAGSIIVDGRVVRVSGEAGATGIAECDAYLSAMRSCMPKMPEATREAMTEALAATEKAWTEAAAGSSRSYLATACAAARDAAASAFSSFGCTL